MSEYPRGLRGRSTKPLVYLVQRGFESHLRRHVAVDQLIEHQVMVLNTSSVTPTNIGRCGMNTDAVAGRNGGART